MYKNNVEVDCTRLCKSRSHGQVLTSAITKRSVSNESLASFIKSTCANFTKAFDFEGRTALHMSASRGRSELMEWLVRHSVEAFINAKDRESGYTPLHRSIFYGQIHAAVVLIKMGVNTDIVDKDDYKAIEHAMLDRQYMYKHEGTFPSEGYVWGTNTNYTLGTSAQHQRHTPELMTCFNRTHSCVTQVCLGKFHSVWLCEGPSEREVWCCGQIARAGGPYSTALLPTKLLLPSACLQAAVTLNSTVFLMETGMVIQYTLNSADNANQSTSKTPSQIKLPNVKPLMKLSQPIGVCASRNHAVVWNARAIYTWGINVGQLGHSQDEKIVLGPRRVAISMNVKEEAEIQLAAAGDAATVFTTSRGDVYLLHKHICKKIAIKQINLRQAVVEAKVTELGVCSRVTVLLLTTLGQLLIWQDNCNKVTRCVFGLAHQMLITHVALNHDALYFTTKFGEAFIGYISRKTTPTAPQPMKKDRKEDANKSALVKFLEKDDCTSVRITRIPNIHRAVSIAVDSEGLNFACLQIKPTCGLTSLPILSPSSLSKHMECLLETASEDDILHDLTFKVGTKLFPAHAFIIASSSNLLYKLYQDQSTLGIKPTIVLENVHPEVFERILRFMYMGTCDVCELGPCGLKIRREDLGKKESSPDIELIDNPAEISAFEVYSNNKNKKTKGKQKGCEPPPRTHQYCDPIRLVQACAKRLQVLTLHKLLDKFYYRDGNIYLKESATSSASTISWNRENYTELVDTNVCSKDGVLIPAHKCVLAARLEYFNGMFMHSWTESKLQSKVTIPINYSILLPVINFLYTDSCPEVESSESMDFLCSMLIVSDQLFITRLREMCEFALVNLITLKNCTELCQFAHTYNATQLKQYCMEFISFNLCSILESRSLDHLEEELLEDITKHYCKFNPIMSSRIITPFYNAPDDEFVNECAKNCPIDLKYTDEELKKDDTVETVSKRRSKKKIEYTENEKARMRYESVSLSTSLDESGDIMLSLSKISNDEKVSNKNEWIQASPGQSKQQKIVQARLKAISSAKDILNETPTKSFTKLTKNNMSSNMSNSFEDSIASTSRMSVSPKESPIAELARSPQGNLVINHIGPKLSQKQRKKLALQGSDLNTQNIDEFLTKKLVLSSPPEKPKNPWKICEVPVLSSSPKAKTVEFNQILADQKKQKDDFSRIMTKPLCLTQLEDKAIEELERFYNVHETDDELITIRRIELQVSSPQWLYTASKK